MVYGSNGVIDLILINFERTEPIQSPKGKANNSPIEI